MGALMRKRNKFASFTELRKDERGAEAVEFALVGPLLFFLLIGILYLLFVLAVQVSVARSASVGVRYAAIKDKDLGHYPTAAEVTSKVLDKTALLASGSCTGSLDPINPAPNGQLTLSVSCDMPNPLGRAFSGIRNALFGGSVAPPSTLELTADARARRE
jgi:Flp pilus assembly protein TadG